MGRHAGAIEHLAQVRAHGVAERWNAPVLFDAPPLAALRGHFALRLSAREMNVPLVSLFVPAAPAPPVSDAEWILIPVSVMAEVGAWLFGTARVELRGYEDRSDEVLSSSVASYLDHAGDGDNPPTMFEMDARAYVVAIDALRAAGVRTLADETGPRLLTGDRARVAAMIESAIAEPLRVPDLARAVSLSPSHFARAFRTSFGETPAAYLMRRRTEMARELVETSLTSLAEVAAQCGFCSQAHMTARFRQQFGQTPKALRVAITSVNEGS